MGRLFHIAGLALLLAGAIWAGGCSNKTETGYDPPRRLGMSEAQLRALYAPAFTPEARVEQPSNAVDSHRQGGGTGFGPGF